MLGVSIHTDAGLGNQIWRYVVCRVLADRLGYDYGVSHPGWRGPFLNIDWGKEVDYNDDDLINPADFVPTEKFKTYYREESERFEEVDGEVGRADSKLLDLSDDTFINGNFQRMSYIEDYRDEICSWLTYDDKYIVTDYSSEDICVIQLRGGDYVTGSAMLPPEYYQNAMNHMKQNNPNIKFVIVTDDKITAERMLPGIEVVGSAASDEKDEYQRNISWYQYPGGPVSLDYSILNTAKYAIISSSTFAFWPIWTNNDLLNVIAPKYWFDWQRSDGWWRPQDGIVDDERWLWLDRDNNLYQSDTCIEERDTYENS